MGTPYSNSQIDKLGDRIRPVERPSPEDMAMLRTIIEAHEPALEEVERRLDQAGYRVVGRYKTITTILDKLRRQHIRLSQIQDLVGCRMVYDWSLSEQNHHVERIRRLFDEPCEVIDRREQPTHGYRAVHLIPRVDGLRVEIQVRTSLQHHWAEVTEKLGDVWGRAIRYGGEPDQPDLEVADGRTRSDTVRLMRRLSESLAGIEDIVDLVDRRGEAFETDESTDSALLVDELATVKTEAEQILQTLARTVADSAETDGTPP